jgi:hypothetical protein
VKIAASAATVAIVRAVRSDNVVIGLRARALVGRVQVVAGRARKGRAANVVAAMIVAAVRVDRVVKVNAAVLVMNGVKLPSRSHCLNSRCSFVRRTPAWIRSHARSK